jgi:ribonuclease VapC
MSNVIVLDASALIALMFAEPGADKVLAQLPGAIMSTVNILEAATILQTKGIPLEIAAAEIERLLAEIVPLETELAFLAAGLYPATKSYGLSLGDRVCLALGKSRNLPVLTADKIWQKLDIGVEVKLVR